MTRRRMRGSSGITIMELLVGMFITSITLGIAVPQIPAIMAPYRVSSAAQALAAQFSVARMKAIAQNRRHRVNFDQSAGTYVVERETAPNVWAAEGGTQSLPSGCTFGTIAADPVFETTGMLSQAFQIAIDTDGLSKSRTIDVNILGNVEIHAS